MPLLRKTRNGRYFPREATGKKINIKTRSITRKTVLCCTSPNLYIIYMYVYLPIFNIIGLKTLEKLLRRKLLNVKMTYYYFTSPWLRKCA